MNGLPPGLQGWVMSEQAGRQKEASELQRAQGLMQIQGLLAQRQEGEAIKGVMAQNIGNPQAQLQGLLSIGTPRAAAVANQLKGMMPKPAEPYTLAPGGQRRGPNNELLAEAPNRPTAETRPLVQSNFPVGNNMVQPHISRDNGVTWEPIQGSKPSAKFAKQVINVGGAGAAKFTNIKDDPMNPGVQVGFNTATGRMERVPSAENVGGAVAAPTGKTGEEFISGLNPTIASQVKALAEGRQAFPSGFALKSPYWQNMISLVSQYDPSFDAVNYQARASTRRDFTSGTQARNVTAMNTVIGHLDTLDKAASKLNNSDFTSYNKVANLAASETGDPRIREFQVAKEAVANELMRVFRQVGASTTEIQEWSKTIDESGSPAQLRGAIAMAAELLQSRIDAVADQYQRGMGSASKTFQPFSPQALDALKRLKGTQAKTAPAAAIEYLKANPQTKDAFKAKYGYLPEGM